MEASITDFSSAAEARLVLEHERIVRAREKLEAQRRSVEAAREADRKQRRKEQVEDDRRLDDVAQGIETLRKKIDKTLEGSGAVVGVAGAAAVAAAGKGAEAGTVVGAGGPGGPGDKKLNDMRENYWAMVKNVKPVWEEECREFEERKMRRKRSQSGGRRGGGE